MITMLYLGYHIYALQFGGVLYCGGEVENYDQQHWVNGSYILLWWHLTSEREAGCDEKWHSQGDTLWLGKRYELVWSATAGWNIMLHEGDFLRMHQIHSSTPAMWIVVVHGRPCLCLCPLFKSLVFTEVQPSRIGSNGISKYLGRRGGVIDTVSEKDPNLHQHEEGCTVLLSWSDWLGAFAGIGISDAVLIA